MNREHNLFGMERVKNVLKTCTDKHSDEILETVSREIHNFVGDAEQSDDLTLLSIRYTPKELESILTETLVLDNDVHDVPKLNSFMKMVSDKLGMQAPMASQLRLAVEEAVVNVIDYAYPIGTRGNITVKVMSDGQSLKVIIIDTGMPFDPTAKAKADTSLAAEDRQIGGLGILLVRELMDSINYERTEGKNMLTLIKKIKQE